MTKFGAFPCADEGSVNSHNAIQPESRAEAVEVVENTVSIDLRINLTAIHIINQPPGPFSATLVNTVKQQERH